MTNGENVDDDCLRARAPARSFHSSRKVPKTRAAILFLHRSDGDDDDDVGGGSARGSDGDGDGNGDSGRRHSRAWHGVKKGERTREHKVERSSRGETAESELRHLA